TNVIYADTTNMGFSKTSGTLQFTNGGGLTIRNRAGTGRATINLGGEGNSGGTTAPNTGFMLFNGGTVDILAGTMTIGNRTSRAGTSGGNGGSVLVNGVLSFTSGTVDATTINMALNTSTGAGASGTVSVGGGTLTIGSGGVSLVNQG